MKSLTINKQSFLEFIESLVFGHSFAAVCCGRCHKGSTPFADSKAKLYMPVDSKGASRLDSDAQNRQPILLADDLLPQDGIMKSAYSRHSGQDILTRAHTGKAHRHFQIGNKSSQDWLLNRQPVPDLYGDNPHTTGYELNVNGFDDALLQRIEQYWLDHQLCSPVQQNRLNACRCVPIGSWQAAQRQAAEQQEREGSLLYH